MFIVSRRKLYILKENNLDEDFFYFLVFGALVLRIFLLNFVR